MGEYNSMKGKKGRRAQTSIIDNIDDVNVPSLGSFIPMADDSDDEDMKYDNVLDEPLVELEETLNVPVENYDTSSSISEIALSPIVPDMTAVYLETIRQQEQIGQQQEIRLRQQEQNLQALQNTVKQSQSEQQQLMVVLKQYMAENAAQSSAVAKQNVESNAGQIESMPQNNSTVAAIVQSLPQLIQAASELLGVLKTGNQQAAPPLIDPIMVAQDAIERNVGFTINLQKAFTSLQGINTLDENKLVNAMVKALKLSQKE